MSALTDLLAAHQTEQLWKPGGWAGDTACSCGWRMGMWDRKDFPEAHRAHVAKQIEEHIAAVLDGHAVGIVTQTTYGQGYGAGWTDALTVVREWLIGGAK